MSEREDQDGQQDSQQDEGQDGGQEAKGGEAQGNLIVSAAGNGTSRIAVLGPVSPSVLRSTAAALGAHLQSNLDRGVTHLVQAARALAAVPSRDAETAWGWHDLAM